MRSNLPLYRAAVLSAARSAGGAVGPMAAGAAIGAVAGAGYGYWSDGSSGAWRMGLFGAGAGLGSGYLYALARGIPSALKAERLALSRRAFYDRNIFANRMFIGRSVGGW